MPNSNAPYVLGLDLGIASVGWAIRPINPSDITVDNLKMGSRIFDLAVEDDIEKGKDKPKNATRRDARSARRRLWRRRRRKLKIFNLLVRYGLLPEGDYPTPDARQDMLSALDLQLVKEYFPNATHHDQQTFTYALRALALDRELSPHAFGRALYALAQRRGFKSNKKLDGREKEGEKETSQIKQDIAELEKNVAEHARTLAEYFTTVNPEEERIRARWVGRKSYEEEFEAIWTAQARFKPELLTPELKAKIQDAIFFQRPLKSQKGKIAKCELELDENGKRYLPVARKGEPCFQKFRVWEKILNLRVWDDAVDGRYGGGWRPLTHKEQDAAYALAEKSEKVTYKALRKELGFKSIKGVKKGEAVFETGYFNLEVAEDAMIGDRTSARIWNVLNETKDTLTQDEIDQAALYILDYESEDGLRRRLLKSFPTLSEAAATKLAYDVVLEEGYGAYSSVALNKLLAVMIEKRVNQALAKLEVYEAQYGEACELLPPLEEAIGDIRNPTVTRTLAEMRKVVNAIIRRYGKPAQIYVELARDLKRSRKQREEIFRKNQGRKKERENIEKTLQKEFKIPSPNGRDVLKYRLWKECGGICPYTGKVISPADLFGANSRFDIEHIIPFSRSMDDSFANKTLCYAEENRNVKKNQTPFECYGGTDKYKDILDRVSKFEGEHRSRKYKLFSRNPDDTENKANSEQEHKLTPSCLNDTKYMSKLALKYLGVLYGAVNGCVGGQDEDEGGTRVIFASTGKVTAWIRREWRLNEILCKDDQPSGEGADVEKNRNDHRHHAIDALVISLSTPSYVQQLNRAAQLADNDAKARLFKKGNFMPPVPEFKALVAQVVDGIVVSKRVDSKVRGALHEETNLGAIAYPDPYTKKQRRKKRVPVTGITTSKLLDSVVDPGVRRAIAEKLEEVGDAKKLADNPPRLPAHNRNFGVLIVKTAIWETNNPIRVGKGRSARFVKTGANHHMEFYAVLDDRGNEIEWKFNIVSLYEAYERRRKHLPIVSRDFGPKTRFKFSLVKGDAIREKETGKIYFIAGLSTKGEGKGIYITGALNTCAKPVTVIKEEYSKMSKMKRGVAQDDMKGLPKEVAYFRSTNLVDLMKRFEKVRIDPLGNVERSNS